jgi:hypothetical protein
MTISRSCHLLRVYAYRLIDYHAFIFWQLCEQANWEGGQTDICTWFSTPYTVTEKFLCMINGPMKVISGLFPETWGYFWMKNFISTTRNCHWHIHESTHFVSRASTYSLYFECGYLDWQSWDHEWQLHVCNLRRPFENCEFTPLLYRICPQSCQKINAWQSMSL